MRISVDEEFLLGANSRFTQKFLLDYMVVNGLHQLELPLLTVDEIVDLIRHTSDHSSLRSGYRDDNGDIMRGMIEQQTELNRRTIQGYIDMGLLESVNGKVRPQYFIKWALKSNFKLPSTWLEWYEWKKEQPDYIHRENHQDLIAEIERLKSENEVLKKQLNDDLHPRERNTLLKIIAVMAKSGYGNNLSEPHVLADEIAKDADLQGINLKSKTIAEKLKDAKKLIF